MEEAEEATGSSETPGAEESARRLSHSQDPEQEQQTVVCLQCGMRVLACSCVPREGGPTGVSQGQDHSSSAEGHPCAANCSPVTRAHRVTPHSRSDLGSIKMGLQNTGLLPRLRERRPRRVKGSPVSETRGQPLRWWETAHSSPAHWALCIASRSGSDHSNEKTQAQRMVGLEDTAWPLLTLISSEGPEDSTGVAGIVKAASFGLCFRCEP